VPSGDGGASAARDASEGPAAKDAVELLVAEPSRRGEIVASLAGFRRCFRWAGNEFFWLNFRVPDKPRAVFVPPTSRIRQQRG